MSHNHSTQEKQANLCEFKTSLVLKSKQQNINFGCSTKNKLEKRLGAERLRKSYQRVSLSKHQRLGKYYEDWSQGRDNKNRQEGMDVRDIQTLRINCDSEGEESVRS